MARMTGLQLAIEQATRQRDAQVSALARVQRAFAYAQSQMEQLQNYAGDTDARWLGTGSVAVSPELLRHHYQFMDRLQHAIRLQTDVLAKQQAQVDQEQNKLLQAQYRLLGLGQVLERRQAAAQLQQKRREQRQTDEFATLQYARTQLLSGDAR